MTTPKSSFSNFQIQFDSQNKLHNHLQFRMSLSFFMHLEFPLVGLIGASAIEDCNILTRSVSESNTISSIVVSFRVSCSTREFHHILAASNHVEWICLNWSFTALTFTTVLGWIKIFIYMFVSMISCSCFCYEWKSHTFTFVRKERNTTHNQHGYFRHNPIVLNYIDKLQWSIQSNCAKGWFWAN